jgi:adenosylcobyric acid synthase
MTKALMIQGTSSHAGKSVLAAAFGRWLKEQGLRVAPFKAQNMSLNSFVTLQGEEIARSQATQAEALGLEPTADMNPILLKPMDQGCQVIVQGKPAGIMSIQEYYAFKPQAWHAITESYRRLAAHYDAVVLEGAGSPVEINLREHDLVNMRMADYADSVVVLITDIERGGAFAQLIGTWELLIQEERARVAGFLINKFRGDASLLDPGLEYVKKRTGKPVFGVLPFDPAVQLDEEDSLGLPSGETSSAEIEVAVLRLPGISNFTDFAPLARMPHLAVRYVSQPGQLGLPDLLILPGTRTTLRALDWMKANGWVEAILRLSADQQPNNRAPLILGLCGGLQLLGRSIEDPEGVESSSGRAEGLGLLEIDTRFGPTKMLYRVDGEVVGEGDWGLGCSVIGYEVHQGISRRRHGTAAWLRLRRQPGGELVEDGAISQNGQVAGTYIHGLFDDARFCRALVDLLRRRRGLAPLETCDELSRQEFWTRRYRRLPGWLKEHCDLQPVSDALGLTLQS